jgi:hypothetical protein
MIQFILAIAIGSIISKSVAYNCDLPEWGFVFDQTLHDKLLFERDSTLIIRDSDLTSITELIERFRTGGYDNIVIEGYCQAIDLFYDKSFYSRGVFSLVDEPEFSFNDDELVINIRAKELLDGNLWYPLVPPSFYQSLVIQTGLKPVLIGQLEDSLYLTRIMELIPSARIIQSGGSMIDFNRLRKAKHLCIAVSTFSWLAAWLSDAATIHYPMLGFLHPGTFKAGLHNSGRIDLAPADDPRYRFYLFPKIYGAPENVYLPFVERVDPIYKEIPKVHVSYLKRGISQFPRRIGDHIFDEIWYLKTYIDAAWEVSEGWYYDASHHYLEIGAARGYRPHLPLYVPNTQNVALRKPATQSSISIWSIGQTIEADARRAVDGVRDKDLAFHTSVESNPWWKVDLVNIYNIECINLFNRRAGEFIRRRIFPFVIERSLDDLIWEEICRSDENRTFGSETGVAPPFQWHSEARSLARYVRITTMREEAILHLSAVEVYGSLVEIQSWV